MLEIGKKWNSGEAGHSDVSTKGLNKNPSSKFFQTLQKSASKEKKPKQTQNIYSHCFSEVEVFGYDVCKFLKFELSVFLYKFKIFWFSAYQMILQVAIFSYFV